MKKGIIITLLLFGICCSLFAAKMIEVSVDVLEIKTSKSKELGFEWNNSITFTEKEPLPPIFEVNDFDRKTALSASLKALITDNNAQILANPRVVTESGQDAAFLVGGEIPVPVASEQGVSLEWKQYGVNLRIKPELEKDMIRATLGVSVKDLDYAGAVKIQGFDVPAVLSREANATVVIKDGDTIVIAGLKQSKKSTTEKKVPILGSIPFLNLIFSSNVNRVDDTSLVLFVTFNIVK